jgi:hypothetical protein
VPLEKLPKVRAMVCVCCDLSRRCCVQPYYRDPLDRIYVNRDLRLDRIEFVGFDMDYTLAVYREPEFEQLTFDTAIRELVKMGYPTGEIVGVVLCRTLLMVGGTKESCTNMLLIDLTKLDRDHWSQVRCGLSHSWPYLRQRARQLPQGIDLFF